jgi:hypothetical protein
VAILFQKIQQFVFTAVYVESSEKNRRFLAWSAPIDFAAGEGCGFFPPKKLRLSIAESLQEEILISIKIELR